jgi:outer membrane lipoprotein-sorting protein
MTRSLAAALVSLLPLAGCAPEPLPAYTPMSEQGQLQVLRDRSHAIRTISAQGSITLSRANGDTVRFDTVVVVQPPDRARVRAWKFGQAIFDMTLTPDGLWIMAPKDDERRPEMLAAGSNTGKLISQWLRLMTGSFDNPNLTVRADDGKLLITEPNDDGTTMSCGVDRKTLTPRRYVLKDRGGTIRVTLTLGNYGEFNGIAWPRTIEADSESGRIMIELREVEINGDIPPEAFHPPARAEKLQ